MALLNINNMVMCTEVEGPGKRFVLWCQGCLKKCKGCCNIEMQSVEKKNILDSKDIIALIIKAKVDFNIEGVTFLGGEPMLQAKGLVEIASWCKENNISVMTFTGYRLEELKNEKIQCSHDLVKLSDILIDGEFDEELYDEERKWVGSKNQKAYFFSNRYNEDILENNNLGFEIRIENTKITLNGWPVI